MLSDHFPCFGVAGHGVDDRAVHIKNQTVIFINEIIL